MKKKLLTIFILLLLTGCKVNYNIDIKSDKTIEEKVSFTESSNYLLQYGNSINNAMDNILDFYLSGENNIEPQVVIKKRKVSDSNKGNNVTYNLKKTITSINNYSKTLFFNYYFENSSINEENNIYTIYGNSFNWKNIETLINDYKYKFNLEKITIAIHCDYVVTYNNATTIDIDNNTYYWDVTSSNANSFELKLSYSKNEQFTNKKENTNVLEQIGGNIVETITNGKVDGEKYIKDNKVGFILIIILVIALITGVVIILKRKINKSNKI